MHREQLEAGLVNSTFEQRSYQQELGLAQRYYQKTSAAWIVDTSAASQAKYHMVTMRTTPTVIGGGTGYSYSGNGEVLIESQTTKAATNITYSAEVS